MRLVDYDKLQLKLRNYADKKADNGEIEIANGILKAKCFIDQECEIINEKQLNGGWIPVSERLPTLTEELKNEGYVQIGVIITIKDVDMSFVAWYDIEDNNFYDDTGYLGKKVDNVIAWQPLPEPWKEVVNE